MTPATAPPSAPLKFITKSATPCVPAFRLAGTDSVNKVEQAISVADQPRPSKNKQIASWTDCSAAEVPEIMAEVSSSEIPSPIVANRPIRSVKYPITG